MKKSIISLGILAVISIAFLESCKKKKDTPVDDEQTVVSIPPYQIGQPISAGTALSGSIKGTMTTGNTYTVGGDVVINIGDTVLLQEGVNVCVNAGKTIVVKGVLISLGSKGKPNSFSACGVNKINTIAQAQNPTTDPAWGTAGAGVWCGIQCDTSCKLLVLKWTHVEFVGAAFAVTQPFVGGGAGSKSKGITFQNPNGDFIMEDSWMYGTIDDAIRLSSGRCSIMRNTFEKCGYVGGDCVNAKSGSVGDMAYNLFVGTATNGTKASNKGGIGPQTNINMYNNTYICGGYRQVQTARSADINYEEGAKGSAYNNLIVNCKYGFRVMGPTPNAAAIPAADTTNLFYGNNYIYGDSASVCNQFYPVGYCTKPSAYIIPNNGAGTNYIFNGGANGAAVYNASALATSNNPLFVGFSLPITGISRLSDINFVGSFDFRLQSASPAIGKGKTNFSPLNSTASTVTNPNFKADISNPGIDIGCYQSSGGGNQH
jgi:hypothetical protein